MRLPLTFDPDDPTATLTSAVPTQLERARPRPVPGRPRRRLGRLAPDRAANVVRTYGLTESFGGVVYDRRPLPGVEVAIGADGEVLLRSPTLLRCYRDGTDPKDPDGWLPTGDEGALDDDGLLTVHGRRGDVIVTGGEKVWPDPVEAALRRVPGVADVAVIGRPDPEWGQAVTAVVVPSDPGDPPSLDALRAGGEGVAPGLVRPEGARAAGRPAPHRARQGPPPGPVGQRATTNTWVGYTFRPRSTISGVASGPACASRTQMSSRPKEPTSHRPSGDQSNVAAPADGTGNRDRPSTNTKPLPGAPEIHATWPSGPTAAAVTGSAPGRGTVWSSWPSASVVWTMHTRASSQLVRTRNPCSAATAEPSATWRVVPSGDDGEGPAGCGEDERVAHGADGDGAARQRQGEQLAGLVTAERTRLAVVDRPRHRGAEHRLRRPEIIEEVRRRLLVGRLPQLDAHLAGDHERVVDGAAGPEGHEVHDLTAVEVDEHVGLAADGHEQPGLLAEEGRAVAEVGEGGGRGIRRAAIGVGPAVTAVVAVVADQRRDGQAADHHRRDAGQQPGATGSGPARLPAGADRRAAAQLDETGLEVGAAAGAEPRGRRHVGTAARAGPVGHDAHGRARRRSATRDQGAAVDHQGVAGDPRGEVAGQEQGAVGDVVGLAEPPERACAWRSPPRAAPTGPGPCRSSPGRGRWR